MGHILYMLHKLVQMNGLSCFARCSKLADLIALRTTKPALFLLGLIQRQFGLAIGADHVIAQLHQLLAFGANELALGHFLVR